MSLLFGNKAILVALTYKCNAYCKKCMTRYHRNRDTEMSEFLLHVLLKKLKLTDFPGIISVGSGEPLLYGNLEFFISSILSINSKISLRILSNGLIFDETLPDIFFDKRVKWGITLDAFTQRNLLGFQYGIDIEKVKDNIRRVTRKYGSDSIYLNYTLTRANYYEFLNFCDFAVNLGIREIYATELKVYEHYEKRLEAFVLPHDDDVYATMNRASEFLRSVGIRDNGVKIFMPYNKVSCFTSNRASPIIDVDGSVSFCSGREDVLVGNITDYDIAEKWENMSKKIKPVEFCCLCHSHQLKNGTYNLPGVIDVDKLKRENFSGVGV